MRRECHEEMQEDGSMRTVCEEGDIITVYEGASHKGNKGESRKVHHKNVKMVHPNLPKGTPVKPCDPNLPEWEEVAVEEVEPHKETRRSRRPMHGKRKEMMEMEEGME